MKKALVAALVASILVLAQSASAEQATTMDFGNGNSVTVDNPSTGSVVCEIFAFGGDYRSTHAIIVWRQGDLFPIIDTCVARLVSGTPVSATQVLRRDLGYGACDVVVTPAEIAYASCHF